MAIKFISVKCPECKANLPMEEGRKEMFCSYCGTKVIMYNDNEYIYRHIDEAGIKQADAKRAIELKRIEYAEKKLKERSRRKRTKIVVSIIIGIISVLCIIIGVTVHEIWELCTVGVMIPLSLLFIWFRELNGDGDDEDDFGEKIKIPTGAYNYVGKNLYDVEAQLKSAGFVNVNRVPLNDLKIGLIYKPNTVQSLTINGQVVTSARKKYSKNAKVVITYHNYA